MTPAFGGQYSIQLSYGRVMRNNITAIHGVTFANISAPADGGHSAGTIKYLQSAPPGPEKGVGNPVPGPAPTYIIWRRPPRGRPRGLS